MMDGGIIPQNAMGGGILALEDIAAAGIGETPAAEPAATDDIHIFGRNSSAVTFANLAERTGLSGLPASGTGDGGPAGLGGGQPALRGQPSSGSGSSVIRRASGGQKSVMTPAIADLRRGLVR